MSVAVKVVHPVLPNGTWQLLGHMIWSETLDNPATTVNAAGSTQNLYGPEIFNVVTAVNVYVSISATPDATTSPRIYVPAGVSYDFIVRPGDKLAWIAA